jgi:NAD(P)-dependent dehydrogenase (short-subunit alcohol dehydrogenase family)
MTSRKFQNQKIVIVGGSSGMGLATAQLLSEQGVEVVIGSRNEDKLKEAVATLSPNASYSLIDVTDESSIEAFFNKVGQFDHLFITAASPSFTAFKEINIAQGKEEFGGKFWGQFAVVQKAIPLLKPNGSVVLMSGGYSLRPEANSSIMAAANGAIEALVRALAVEFSPFRFNAVAPGLVDTPLIHAAVPEEYRIPLYKQMEEKLLTKRMAKSEDIANAVEFLFSNPHITGSTLRIDGGTTLF